MTRFTRLAPSKMYTPMYAHKLYLPVVACASCSGLPVVNPSPVNQATARVTYRFIDMNICEQLISLFERYRSHGIMSGVELLLPPSQALRLIDDLESLGVAIWSLQCWLWEEKRDGSGEKVVIEDAGEFLDFSDEMMAKPNAVQQTAQMARHYILMETPKNTAYVEIDVQKEYFECFNAHRR